MAISSDGLLCCEVCGNPITGMVAGPDRQFSIPCYDTIDVDQWDKMNAELVQIQEEDARERTNEA